MPFRALVGAGGRRHCSSISGPGLNALCYPSFIGCRLLLQTPSLLDDEFGCRGNRLFGNIIAYLDSQLVSSWCNVLYWQTLLQGHLVALGQVLDLVDDGFLVGGIHNVMLH